MFSAGERVSECEVLAMSELHWKRKSSALCVGNELWARSGRDVLSKSQLRSPCFSLYASEGSYPCSCFYEPHGYTPPVEAE